jgi:hypothetical protein
MSLTSAAVDLHRALEPASVAWEEVKETWKDPVSRDFEANLWQPLEGRVLTVLSAMDRLAPVLARALRDCS